jgi:hypothetical protein
MATIVAVTAALDDVQDAIDTASTGDTVTVPAGEVNWSGAANITGKDISLVGAGVTSTIISRGSAGAAAIDLNETASKVTGFRVNNGGMEAYGTGWRIGLCSFYNDTWATTINCTGQLQTAQYGPTGLVDQCYFQRAVCWCMVGMA